MKQANMELLRVARIGDGTATEDHPARDLYVVVWKVARTGKKYPTYVVIHPN